MACTLVIISKKYFTKNQMFRAILRFQLASIAYVYEYEYFHTSCLSATYDFMRRSFFGM